MLPSFANDTVTIIEPSWFDDRGTLVPDYDAAQTVTAVRGCLVQPGASTEDLDGRTNVIVRYTAYLPPGTDVTEFSAVEYENRRYSVDGFPAAHKSPTNAVSHIVALLIDWEG